MSEFFQRTSYVENFENSFECFLIKYEDFVDGKIDHLSEYVGYDLKKVIEVPKEHHRVVRTKSYGDWRNWFTPDDVDFFKPKIDPFLKKMGYPLEWNLNKVQKIHSEKATEYFLKLINERRKESNMGVINI